MKHLLLSATCLSFAFTGAFAQSAAPVYTESDINNQIIQQGICPHDTASFASLYRHPETRSAHGNPLRNAPQTAPLTMTNPGFETADFTGWSGWIGDNNSNSFGPLQNIQMGIFSTTIDAALTSSTSRHTIMSAAAGNDFYGGFPVVPASIGNYCVRLGGQTPNFQGEVIFQSFVVDAGQPDFTINYAFVLNSTTSPHPPAQQPYYKYEMLDSNGVVFASQYFTTTDTTLLTSDSIPTTGGFALYKPWDADTISLTAHIGHPVTFRVTAAGCTQSGHFGYGYIDTSYPYVTGVSETSKPSFSIYPNPANDYFEISGNVNSDNGMVQVLDCLGQIVDVNVTPTANGWKVDMSDKTPGVYFVEVFSGNSKSVQRLIRQ